MKPISILIRREFHEQFAHRLADLAPSATFLTYTTHDEMLTALHQADGLYGSSPSDDIVQRSGRLKWIHMRRAGVEHDEPATLAAHGITLTKGAGAFDVAIAEHVLAMALGLARCIPHSIRSQASASWNREVAPIQMSGRALGVYGVGSVGSEVARKGSGLGMRAYGVTRRPKPTPPFMEALWTEERFDEFLALSDVVVMCAALTEATRGRFGAREFGLMKPSSYFINMCRGQTVVQDDLIAALESGSIAGAGLDVTDPEPLPDGSPLWNMPNVIITPHVSGLSDGTEERADDIVFENIRRFAGGEPLVNVVDPNEGY